MPKNERGIKWFSLNDPLRWCLFMFLYFWRVVIRYESGATQLKGLEVQKPKMVESHSGKAAHLSTTPTLVRLKKVGSGCCGWSVFARAFTHDCWDFKRFQWSTTFVLNVNTYCSPMTERTKWPETLSAFYLTVWLPAFHPPP